MLFHVTDAATGREIWETGSLLVDDDINQNRGHRREMRQRIDSLAHERTAGWVPRTGAIFAWASFDGALRYAQKFREPAIVQFDCSGPAWCVDNAVVEDVYSEYSSDMPDAQLEQLVDCAEKWSNQRDSSLEVWFQPESIGSIDAITDENGDPLELE